MNATKLKPMPRKKANQGGAEEPRDVVPVKMERELHRKAKMLALSKKMELYKFLDELMRPSIERDYKQLIRE